MMPAPPERPLDLGQGAGRIVLVAGATGRQGSHVAARLASRGWSVRALTRDPQRPRARRLAEMGAEVVWGDLDRPDSLARAAAGAYGVYSVQSYWQHGFAREVAQGKRLADAALAAGVEHFVYSSAGGVGRTDGLGIEHLDSKAVIERYVERIGLPHTVLRPVTFYENFVTPRFLRRIVDQGVLYTPFAGGRDFQMVALEDIGVFTALALAHPEEFLYRRLELASDSFTFEEFAGAIGEALGRHVRYRRMSRALLWVLSRYVHYSGRTAYFGTGRSTYAQICWNNRSATGGWAADIGRLRRYYPATVRMREWVQSIDWRGLRAALDPKKT